MSRIWWRLSFAFWKMCFVIWKGMESNKYIFILLLCNAILFYFIFYFIIIIIIFFKKTLFNPLNQKKYSIVVGTIPSLVNVDSPSFELRTTSINVLLLLLLLLFKVLNEKFSLFSHFRFGTILISVNYLESCFTLVYDWFFSF